PGSPHTPRFFVKLREADFERSKSFCRSLDFSPMLASFRRLRARRDRTLRAGRVLLRLCALAPTRRGPIAVATTPTARALDKGSDGTNCSGSRQGEPRHQTLARPTTVATAPTAGRAPLASRFSPQSQSHSQSRAARRRERTCAHERHAQG